jgi:hypothetical protein
MFVKKEKMETRSSMSLKYIVYFEMFYHHTPCDIEVDETLMHVKV